MVKVKVSAGRFKGTGAVILLAYEACPKCKKEFHYPLHRASKCPDCGIPLIGRTLCKKLKKRIRYHLKPGN